VSPLLVVRGPVTGPPTTPRGWPAARPLLPGNHVGPLRAVTARPDTLPAERPALPHQTAGGVGSGLFRFRGPTSAADW